VVRSLADHSSATLGQTVHHAAVSDNDALALIIILSLLALACLVLAFDAIRHKRK